MSAVISLLAAKKHEGHVESRHDLYAIAEAAMADLVSREEEEWDTAALLFLNLEGSIDVSVRPDPAARALLLRAAVYFHGLTFAVPEGKRCFLFLLRDIAHAIVSGDTRDLENRFRTLRTLRESNLSAGTVN